MIQISKRSLAAVLSALLLSVSSLGQTAQASPEIPSSELAQLSWKTPISNDYSSDQPFTKLWVTQGFQGGVTEANIPHLFSHKDPLPNATDARLCDELDDECLPDSNWRAMGYGFFQLCADSKVAPCIRGVEYQDNSGVWKQATLSRAVDLTAPADASRAWLQNGRWGEPGTTVDQFQTKWGWKENSEINLPGSGKGPLVFKFPGRPNKAGTETYALDATFDLSASKKPGGSIAVDVSDFVFQITPVKELACDNRTVSVFLKLKRPSGFFEFGQSGGSCIYPSLFTTPNSSGFATKFADDLPIRLELEMPKALSGWFQGRLDAPSVSVEPLTSSTSVVIVTGKPTVIPTTNKALELTDPKNQGLLGSKDYDWARNSAKFGYVGITGSMWRPFDGVNKFNQWAPFLGNQARGSINVWSISHFTANQTCMDRRDGLQGLVTTNAMVYQPATPDFKNGFLEYSVGGVHLDQDGKVVLGTYNFLMKKSVAQCLYGFTSAPISGTVSVTSSDGQEQVAFTSVTEKDGWLKLTAEGFTFSSPKISAKLTQVSPKKTIRCVKGKTVRVITGVSPVCPKGFKKR